MTHRPNPRMFQAIGRLNRTRSALAAAVRTTDTLPELRAAVLELASDIESFLNGAEPASEIAESRRDTEPCPPPAADVPRAAVWAATYLEEERPAPDDWNGARAHWADLTKRAQRYLAGEDEPSAPDVPITRPSGGP